MDSYFDIRLDRSSSSGSAMAGEEIIQQRDQFMLPSPSPITVGIAIDGKTKSKYTVRWALDKFIPEGNVLFKLLHVHPRIVTVPTPMGNMMPISQVRQDVAMAYRKDVEWQTTEMLLPFKKIITYKKVQADLVIIESDDIAKAIAEEVTKSTIDKLVIGAASRGMFSRRVRKHNLTSRIADSTPNSCTVYAVSKGKLTSIRPSDLESNASIRDDSSETSCSTNSGSTDTSSSHRDSVSTAPSSHYRTSSLPKQRFQALSQYNRDFLNSGTSSLDANHSRSQSLISGESDRDVLRSDTSGSDVGNSETRNSSFRSSMTDIRQWTIDEGRTLDAPIDAPSPAGQADINFELEKLRIELRHVRGMYETAQTEAVDTTRKVDDLNRRRLEEAMKLKDIKLRESLAKELARQEKEKYEAARREAEYVKECAEREASERRDVELKASRDVKEKEKLENALHGHALQYQTFTWEEIVAATSSFSKSCKIGMGAYGTVYKCSLHHTTVAVKILRSQANHNSKQFLRELEILSKVRHPHLLLLIGACPDHGCLIYEYMESGNLEERLLRKEDNTPPIPWFSRFRIAWEVASALAFLHNSKPDPIIHRDLKPANILLNHNFVSKIGDVGLATMLQTDPLLSTAYKETGPVGTLCYIDPEYQRTGLISPKSDVYALGMVILQLLTAKPAIALAHKMETAIENGLLFEIVDQEAGNWPLEETTELALLGLSCAELRRRDRPDLNDEVLPALERLKEAADKATSGGISRVRSPPPNHFICPIVKDVMNDPCVAADGYSYDRKAIEKWLEENDKSPMTNLLLPNKNLLPNYTLLSAIREWNSTEKNAST